ncbi:nitroreductase family protein [Parvularcula oceani]|uniref:nitroreductase family protein n=1 Tax=Parvularcula oceani TaxID=1247963 RepID=UPI0004E12F72|nr:nitroreductase family protein [Parvularcula oceani]
MKGEHVPLTGLHPRDTRSDEERLAAAEAFRELMARRHTTRDFSDKPVPRGIVESAIRTAASAPSGANHQPWHFCLVGDAAVKRRIRAAAEAEERGFYGGRAGEEWLEALAPLGTDASKPFLENAPWLIVMFAERKRADGSKNYYVPESCGIALGFLIAGLHAAGLATLTHTPAPMGFLSEELGRPPNEKPYVLLVTGHAAEGATVPRHALEKKPLGDILSVF